MSREHGKEPKRRAAALSVASNTTLIILKVVDLVIGLRVSEEVERDGLDLALHGETVQ